jgi:hypothetical protein
MAAFKRIDANRKQLIPRSVNDKDQSIQLPDPFVWERMAIDAVKAGYGSFKSAIQDDIVTVALFLFLQNDYRKKVTDFLSGH